MSMQHLACFSWPLTQQSLFTKTCISESEVYAINSTGAADVDFLAWLRGTVSQAARVAEEYQTLTQIVQDVRADIESQFQLTCVMVSHSPALSLSIGIAAAQGKAMQIVGWHFQLTCVMVSHSKEAVTVTVAWFAVSLQSIQHCSILVFCDQYKVEELHCASDTQALACCTLTLMSDACNPACTASNVGGALCLSLGDTSNSLCLPIPASIAHHFCKGIATCCWCLSYLLCFFFVHCSQCWWADRFWLSDASAFRSAAMCLLQHAPQPCMPASQKTWVELTNIDVEHKLLRIYRAHLALQHERTTACTASVHASSQELGKVSCFCWWVLAHDRRGRRQLIASVRT